MQNLYLLGATHVCLNLLMSFAVWLVYFAACVQLYIFLRSLCFLCRESPHLRSSHCSKRKKKNTRNEMNYERWGVWPAHLLSVRLMFGSSIGAEYHGNIHFNTSTTTYTFLFYLKKNTTRWRKKLVLLYIPYLTKSKPLLEKAFRDRFVLSSRATLSMYFEKIFKSICFRYLIRKVHIHLSTDCLPPITFTWLLLSDFEGMYASLRWYINLMKTLCFHFPTAWWLHDNAIANDLRSTKM